MHALSSSHAVPAGAAGLWHSPISQKSVVQGSASSQGFSGGQQSSGANTWVQPWPGMQLSSVQGSASAQSSRPSPVQAPAWQVSVGVQASSSLQGGPVRGGLRQPRALSQAVAVQGSPSSQSATLAPRQVPLRQVSPRVQTLASLQLEPSTARCWHAPAMQVSAVQVLPSSHGLGAPAQVPLVQVSNTVQASASLQFPPVRATARQPPEDWQVS